MNKDKKSRRTVTDQDIVSFTTVLKLVAKDRERAAKAQLRKMSPDAWNELRMIAIRLDEWLDDVILERLAKRNTSVKDKK